MQETKIIEHINTENNKRIAKNTILLYFRMLLTMVVSLYTSRIVLKTLGIEDFGIYNIVGGLVVLFTFLNNAMTSATQRFLNYELGKGDNNQLEKTFSMSMTAHITIALIVIILSETIGLWFLNHQLNIPDYRMNAANWAYQFVILIFCLDIIKIPYNASIIAYEKMAIYAYISIIEVLLKLLAVYILVLSGFDKLKIYVVLLFLVSLIIFFIYKIYCKKKLSICNYSFFWQTDLYKKLMSFSGWSLFGAIANIGAQQGVNVLLNIFYGVTINASTGIANQVSRSVFQFISNFQIAFKPQIIKSYAQEDKQYFMKLIFQTSKFSYFLLFIISFPVLINVKFLLGIWLTQVPEHTAHFCQLIILCLLIDAMSAPLWISAQATGEIKYYQILLSSIVLLNLPLAYIVLKLKFPPESALIVRILINIITFITRIIYLRPKIQLPVGTYLRDVIGIVCLVSIITIPIPLILNHYLSSWYSFIVSTTVAVLITGITINFVGLKANERLFIKHIILKKVNGST